MADLKDFGTVRSWYKAYKEVLGEAVEKKKEDEKKPKIEVLPKEGGEEQEEEKKPEEKSEGGEVEKLKAEIERLKGEVQKKDLEVKKKDAETTVEPNPETGEVPLRVGIAQSILDKKKKSEKKEVKEMAKDKAYAIGMDAAKKKYNDEPPLDKKTITKGHEIAKKLLKKESLDEARDLNAVDYARRLSGYAVKFGGIDKRDFMKIADKLSNAKNDNDLKTIGKQVDSLDTEPRDLIKGSIALQMGPKTYKTMFGDRLTARDMNVYKDMTPRSMKEETLDEVNKDAVGTITTSQMNRLKSAYNSLPDRIDPEKSMALAKMLDRFGEGELRQLVKPDIKFISTLAVNKLIMKHGYKAKDIHDIRNEK